MPQSLFDMTKAKPIFDMSKAQPLGGEAPSVEAPGLIQQFGDWAHGVATERQNAELKSAAAGDPHPLRAAVESFAPNLLVEGAKTVQELLTPTNVAIGAGAAASAPIRAGVSALGMAQGGLTGAISPYSALYRGMKQSVLGTNEGVTPEQVHEDLLKGSMFYGGAAGVAEAAPKVLPAVQSYTANRATNNLIKAHAGAINDLMKAVPPTKTYPYTQADIHTTRPYLETIHKTAPIESPMSLRDAADTAIGHIENKITQYTQTNPNVPIQTNPLREVRSALAGHPRAGFAAAGLKELEGLGLDQPITTAKADAIRRQLNQENKATLKKNNYDQYTAGQTDPGYAAREVASRSLRNGVYQSLERQGVAGVRQLRLDEGSLTKVRNASDNQINNSEKTVKGTAPRGMARTIAKGLVTAGATAAGGELGGVPGAIVGSGLGATAASFISPGDLTREALIKRSFEKSFTSGSSYPPPPPTTTNPRRMLPRGPLQSPPRPSGPQGIYVPNPVTTGTRQLPASGETTPAEFYASQTQGSRPRVGNRGGAQRLLPSGGSETIMPTRDLKIDEAPPPNTFIRQMPAAGEVPPEMYGSIQAWLDSMQGKGQPLQLPAQAATPSPRPAGPPEGINWEGNVGHDPNGMPFNYYEGIREMLKGPKPPRKGR